MQSRSLRYDVEIDLLRFGRGRNVELEVARLWRLILFRHKTLARIAAHVRRGFPALDRNQVFRGHQSVARLECRSSKTAVLVVISLRRPARKSLGRFNGQKVDLAR